MPKRVKTARAVTVSAVILTLLFLLTLTVRFLPVEGVKFNPEDDFSNIKLSSSGTVTVTDEGIFRRLEITQNKVSVINISGEVDLVAFEAVVAGDVSVRVGEDKIYSDIKNIEISDDGTFSFEFQLNQIFCSQFGNEIPVVFGYTEKDDTGLLNVREYSVKVGVITYDYESGVLFAPAGASYTGTDGKNKPLGKNYVPEDCLIDANGNVSIYYDSNTVTFKPNPVKSEEIPDLGSGHGILERGDNSITFNAVEGLEYGVIRLTGSIDESYGQNIDWIKAESKTLFLSDIENDEYYTLWVRKPAGEGTLAGAPIYLGTIEPETDMSTPQERLLAEKKEELKAKLKEKTDGVIVTADLVNDYIVRINKVEFLPDEAGTDPDAYVGKLIEEVTHIYNTAEKEFAFLFHKSEAIESIETLLSGNRIPAESAESYLSQIENISFYYDEITGDSGVYADALTKQIDAVVAQAVDEADFADEKLRQSESLKNSVKEKLESGKYSASQSSEMNEKLDNALSSLQSIDFRDADRDAKVAAIVENALKEFEEVKISNLSSGELPHSGDLSGYDYPASFDKSGGLWGNIISSLGMPSKLSLNIGFTQRNGDSPENAEKVGVSGQSEEELNKAVSDKIYLFSFKVNLTDDSGTVYTAEDGQIFTVRILLPEEYRLSSGIQVISESDGKVSVYKTEREGKYLVFETGNPGEFSVIADKTVNLTWALIVIGVLLLIEVIIIVRFSLKLKKDRKGRKLVAFFPILAIVFTPEGIIPAMVTFGGLAVIGGVASVVLVVKSRANSESDTSINSEATDEQEKEKSVSKEKFSEKDEISEFTAANEPAEETTESEEHNQSPVEAKIIEPEIDAAEVNEPATEETEPETETTAEFTAANEAVEESAEIEEQSQPPVEAKIIEPEIDAAEVNEPTAEETEATAEFTAVNEPAEETTESEEHNQSPVEAKIIEPEIDADNVTEPATEETEPKTETTAEFTAVNEPAEEPAESEEHNQPPVEAKIIEPEIDAAEVNEPTAEETEPETETTAEFIAVNEPAEETTESEEQDENLAKLTRDSEDENGKIAFVPVSAVTDNEKSDNMAEETEPEKPDLPEESEKEFGYAEDDVISQPADTEYPNEAIQESSLTVDDYSAFATKTELSTEDKTVKPIELEQVEAAAYREAVRNASLEDVEESDAPVDKPQRSEIEPSDWDDDEGFSAYDETELTEKPKIKTVAAVIPPISNETTDESEIQDEEAETSDNTEESEDDSGEDKKIFSLGNGNRVYVTYDYSFESKLIMSSEDVQRRYALISDVLMSYGLKKRESWKKDRYYLRGTSYAQIIFRGKTLCVCLAIAPESLEGSKYYFDDVSSVKKYENVPVLLRVRSSRGCKYAVELIDMMMESAGISKKRELSKDFILRPYEDKMQLIERGLIRVMMTDGEGEVVAADFEAMKAQKFNLAAGMPLLKKVSVEQVAQVPDTEVESFIESEDETETVLGRRKGIINIDTISDAFSEGETVTLKKMIAKQLVPKNVNYIKVLARGVLDKPLTVKAHDFSMDAVKMIVIVGGNAVKLKSK